MITQREITQREITQREITQREITQREIALLRLAAQRIAGLGLASASETVRRLTAVQAQDRSGALTSVALRTSSGTRQSMEAALNAGEIVRSWPMRGTLHLVLAEDFPGCWTSRLPASWHALPPVAPSSSSMNRRSNTPERWP